MLRASNPTFPMVPAKYRRICEVWSSNSGGSFGTGTLLGGGLILTARHVIDPNGLGEVTELCARPLGIADLVDLLPAKLIWPLPEFLADLNIDAALIRIDPWEFEGKFHEKVRIAPPDQWDDLGIGVLAVGFPRFAKMVGPRRDTDEISGRIRPGATVVAGRYQIEDMTFSDSTKNDRLDWHGFSGAGLLAGDRLVGVVTARKTPDERYQFSAIRIERLLVVPEFFEYVRGAAEIVGECADASLRTNSRPEQRVGAADNAASPFCRAELSNLKRMIAEAGVTTASVRAAYLDSYVSAMAPTDDIPDFCSNLVDDVAAHGLPAMLRFLGRLIADDILTIEAAEVWASRQPALVGHQLSSMPALSEEPVVLVKVMTTIETIAAASLRDRTYLLDAWVFNGPKARRIDPGPAIRDAKHSFAGLPGVIQDFVTSSLRYLPNDAEVSIVELALPFELLTEAVERWQVKGRAFHRTLGSVFPLALRSYERLYEDEFKDLWLAWRQTWKHLPSQVHEGALHWLRSSDPWGKTLHDAIAGHSLICVALACAEVEDISVLVEAGAPVAIWLRDKPDNEIAAQNELRELVCGYRLRGLPGIIHEKRRAQADATIWGGVALLYDDPSRLPPDAEARFRSPV